MISFLYSRVSKLDVHDYAKLMRLFSYLEQTKMLPYDTLSMLQYHFLPMLIQAYKPHRYVVDDCRCNSWSTRQRIVTKSATEAEFVGLSDSPMK